MRILGLLFGLLSVTVMAHELPTGLVRSAEKVRLNTYDFVLSPSYTFDPNGAYLSSEVRYQATEEFGAGLAFGAGEAGFHFGLNGIWHVFPDHENQPGFSILGGIYMNRLSEANYFVVKAAPMVSKAFETNFGKTTPYAGVHITPSFRMGEADNRLALKTTFGNELTFSNMGGTRIFTEFSVGLTNSPHSINLAFAYPFVALGE